MSKTGRRDWSGVGRVSSLPTAFRPLVAGRFVPWDAPDTIDSGRIEPEVSPKSQSNTTDFSHLKSGGLAGKVGRGSQSGWGLKGV